MNWAANRAASWHASLPADRLPRTVMPDRSWWRLLAVEALLYGLALALLNAQAWGPKDVVWTLWATSLVTGYLTLILGSAGASLGAAIKARSAPDFSWQQALPLAVGGLVVMVFFLGFFTVHFGLFHLVHAVFLNEFFPLIDWGDHRPGLIEQALAYLQRCFQSYPLFFLLCLLSHLPGLIGIARGTAGGAGMLIKPYGNVIKLHLMILAIGFSSAAGYDGAAVIVFLAVYFLPLGQLLKLLRHNSADSAKD